MSEEQLARLFGDVTIVQGVLWAVAVGALIFLGVKAWPIIVKFVTLVDVLTELPKMKALLDEIHHEVLPNTGTSMNDAVRRVESELKRQGEQLNEQSGQIAGIQELMENGDAELAERVDQIEDTLQPCPKEKE